jgi:phosphate ABC transporter phosphate-binding protein
MSASRRTSVHVPAGRRDRRLLRRVLGIVAATVLVILGVSDGSPAWATSYTPISGDGSSWSANAIDQWIADVQQYGMTVNYESDGSSEGRENFLNATDDFAGSDIPFQTDPTDGSAPENPVAGSYAYIPVVAGGTTFMYNLHVDGQRVTNLRLSGEDIAKIFTGEITMWNDPAIQADNPGLIMPDEKIVPVIRSDGAGSSAQFSLWLQQEYPQIWSQFCASTGPCGAGAASFWPSFPGSIAQNGDLGVAGYVSQNYAEGAIGYVEYSYALNAGFPVVSMLNAGGYYTEPTPDNVAVSLLQAQINTDSSNLAVYLTQNLTNVYSDTDPRVYPLSAYSYLILPLSTSVYPQFTDAKGVTLSTFADFFECQGQQQAGPLGYSPLPINLVEDSFQQIDQIPGAVSQNINIQTCNNPTFSSTGVNELTVGAPDPPACDEQGSTQCTTGTGGAANQSTPITPGSVEALAAATSSAPTTVPAGTTGPTGSTSSGPASSASSGAATPGATTPGASSGAATPGAATRGASSGASTSGAATPGTTTPGSASSATGAGTSKKAVYNPDTGQLEAAGSPVIATAIPHTLAVAQGWGGSQTLIVAASAVLLGLLAGPPLLVRSRRARRKRADL